MWEVSICDAWMQKHPTPTATDGAYHWHPPSLPEPLRSAVTELASRTPDVGASLWLVGPDWMAWGRRFSAVAPADRRRYTGIAATVARPVRSDAPWGELVPEVLRRMQLPEPVPLCGSGPPDRVVRVSASRSVEPLPPALVHAVVGVGRQAAPLASGLVAGGVVQCAQPTAAELPKYVASLVSWLPPDLRVRPRAVAFASSGAPSATAYEVDRQLCHYLARCWLVPTTIWARDPDYGLRSWKLVLELAEALRWDLPDLFSALSAATGAWHDSHELAAHMRRVGVLTDAAVRACDARAPRPLLACAQDAGWLWARVMHYWGRGFFQEVEFELVPRLGRLLAMRVAADHLFHLDEPDRVELPLRYLRRLCYEVILPRARVKQMVAQLQCYLPSLGVSSG